MTIQNIKREIEKLPLDQVSQLQAWLNQQTMDGQPIDKRIQADAAAAKLDWWSKKR
jgi:hypothetical protein